MRKIYRLFRSFLLYKSINNYQVILYMVFSISDHSEAFNKK